jgi:hypothetical protein
VCQLMLSAEAPGADFEPPELPVNIYGSGTNIGQPLPIGMTLGVTYVMSKPGSLTTDITFSHNFAACLTKIAFTARLRQ